MGLFEIDGSGGALGSKGSRGLSPSVISGQISLIILGWPTITVLTAIIPSVNCLCNWHMSLRINLFTIKCTK